MTIAERLRVAEARIRQGWCQGALDNGEGGVCAFGALLVAFEAEPLTIFKPGEAAQYRLAVDSLSRAIGLPLGETHSIVRWNNAPEQTAENVAAGFALAAVLAEQEAHESTAPCHPEVMASA